MSLLGRLIRWLFGSSAKVPEPKDRQLERAAARLGITHRDRAPRLPPLRYTSNLVPTPEAREASGRDRPYRGAMRHPRTGGWLDLSTDADPRWLEYYGLPLLKTPEDLARWLDIPLGRLGWLTHRWDDFRPASVRRAHYHFHLVPKRSGGVRLIEAPKPLLKQVQQRILRDILDKVPAHPQAHGFCAGKSPLTNARPHVGRRVLLKLDLENFYASVRYNRVVAIFRSLGFSREVGLWLARLTTSAVPFDLNFDSAGDREIGLYLARHLPQGAPTSPALANLSAYSLDVRLTGLAHKFDVTYTRYADDLTFSGTRRLAGALSDFIPLVEQIIRSERFRVNRAKRRVLRNNQRQTVTGVVVNSHPNVARDEFDRLKAILTNCLRKGPSTQNLERHPRFSEHLRGRIAHVLQLNRRRGEKLLALYDRIDWSR